MCNNNVYIFQSNVICYLHLQPRGIAELIDNTESLVPILLEIKKLSNFEYFIASNVLLQVTDKYGLHVPKTTF